MIGQLKYGTSTTQRFFGVDESDTGGVLGVLVDGVLTTGDTLNSGNDYTGTVEVTLSPGSHTWEMVLDGVGQGNQRSFQTAPASGESFKAVVVSDITGDAQGFSTILDENARFGMTNGDDMYLDVNPNMSDKCGCGTLPDGASAVVFATVLTTYRCKHRCHLTNGMFRNYAFQSFPWDRQWHNHEFEVVPFQTTTIAANAGIKYNAAKQAAEEYLFAGNADPATGYDTYPSPVAYRNFMLGDIEVLRFDHTSYGFEPNPSGLYSKFEGTVPNDSGGNNIGSKQLDWAVDTINASTAPLILLITPAEPCHSSQNAAAAAEWQTLFDAVDAKDASIVLICGDTHQALAEMIDGSQLPTRPLLVVNGSPLEHPTHTTNSTAWNSAGDVTIYYSDITLNNPSTTDDVYTGFNYNYVVITRNPNGSALESQPHTIFEIKQALTRQVKWWCYLIDGQRIPVLPSDTVSGALR